jgi:AcrR family transcriptional regulator
MPYPARTDRETIIDTARVLIEREGAESLSLARLAYTLGIKPPSLYRHVASKTALLQAVISHTFERLFEAYEMALPAAGDEPRARLLAILRAHRAFALANPETYVLAFTTTVPEQRADERALEQMALPIQDIMAALTGPEDSLPALRGALALVHGFAMLELKQQLRRGGDLAEAFEAAIAAYLAGWRQPGLFHPH